METKERIIRYAIASVLIGLIVFVILINSDRKEGKPYYNLTAWRSRRRFREWLIICFILILVIVMRIFFHY